MKCFVGLVLLVTLLGVKAYDFDDKAFNEHLFNELQSLEDEIDADHRVRRDTSAENTKECCHQHYRKDMHCCKGNNVDREQYDIFRNAKKECLTEIRNDVAGDAFDPFDVEEMQKIKEKVICLADCVARKYKVLDDKNEFNRDFIVEHYRVQVGDAKWKQDNIEDYVDKCLAKAKEKDEELKKEGKTKEGDCNRQPIIFQKCLWSKFWQGCPEELHVDTPKCNALRQRVTDGNTGFFKLHFLHKYYMSDD